MVQTVYGPAIPLADTASSVLYVNTSTLTEISMKISKK